MSDDSDTAPVLATAAMEVDRAREASRVGEQLGPYRILGALGAGGMGEVYRARDSKLGREVAIKMLPPVFIADDERRARFAREARLLATLNHPHIGAIYGMEDIQSLTVLVLELVEGPTLSERLDRGPMPIPEALAVARQIADALDAAHQKNIIHRDLKPANIVLHGGPGGDPGVKVLDFGLATTGIGARAIDSDQASMTQQRTEAGRILGTPAYMSPEQTRGQVVDKRTDIWAFGCLLFEMLTGKRPFAGSTIPDTIARILEREPEWTALPAETPGSIRILLQRCLRKDPEQRLRDIADARIEIDECDLSAASTELTAGERAARVRAARLTWTAATLGLITAASVGTVAVLLLNRPASPSTAIPMDPIALTIVPPSGTTFGNRLVHFAVSPDGRQIVFSASVGTRSSLWVRPIAAEEYKEIAGTDGAIFPFWKPDSKEIGFFAGGKLKRVALGGVPVDVCDVPPGVTLDGGATWSRDDVILLSQHFTLHRVSAKGGSPTPVTTLAEGEAAHRWPWFLPDGQHFLYVASRQQGLPSQVRVGSFDGRSTLVGPAESNAIYASGYLLFLTGGQLVAQRFDLSTRTASGTPVPVAPLAPVMTGGLGMMSVSEEGVLATSQGIFPRDQRLTWRARYGNFLGTLGQVGVFSNLELSRDDSRVAVSAMTGSRTNFDIWVVDVASGTSEPVTDDPALEFDPSWSPDEKNIGFISTRIPGRYSAYSRAADGTGRDEVLIDSESSVSLTFWSRLGIGYSQGGHLWIRPSNGSPRQAIPSTEGTQNAGALSPDERSIAFVSAKSGRAEVYVRDFPSGEREVRVSHDGGRAPRWRADSKEIYFLGLDSKLIAARMDRPPPPTLETLFQTDLEGNNLKPYAVARDGRFLMPGGPRFTPSISVLVNWTTKLPKQ